MKCFLVGVKRVTQSARTEKGYGTGLERGSQCLQYHKPLLAQRNMISKALWCHKHRYIAREAVRSLLLPLHIMYTLISKKVLSYDVNKRVTNLLEWFHVSPGVYAPQLGNLWYGE